MSLDKRIDRLKELLSDARITDPPSVRDLARTVMDVTRRGLDHAITAVETLLQLSPGALRSLRARIDAQAAKDAELPAWMPPPRPPEVSPPSPPLNVAAPEPEPEGFVSPTQQLADMQRRETATWNARPTPRVVRRRPR